MTTVFKLEKIIAQQITEITHVNKLYDNSIIPERNIVTGCFPGVTKSH